MTAGKVIAIIGAAIVVGIAGLLTFSFFYADVPSAVARLHEQSVASAECRDDRVRSALVRVYGDDIPRWWVVRKANLDGPTGDRYLIRDALRGLWARVLVSDKEMLGALCQLGRKRNFAQLATFLGVRNLLEASDREVEAVAWTFRYDVRGGSGDENLTHQYHQRLAKAD